MPASKNPSALSSEKNLTTGSGRYRGRVDPGGRNDQNRPFWAKGGSLLLAQAILRFKMPGFATLSRRLLLQQWISRMISLRPWA